jgi:hypothetical protein
MTTDVLVEDATVSAASMVIAPAVEPGEMAHVLPALYEHLTRCATAPVARETPIAVPGWRPSPGATDITLGAHEPYAAVIEAKVYQLGWCLWDMVKIASLIRGGKAEAGYLVVAATSTKFAKRPGFGEVLGSQSTIDTQQLFTTYAADWLDLLRGGSGRPVSLPARLETRLLVRQPLQHVAGWEIRVVRVVVLDDGDSVKFTSESWPCGHPRLASPL